MLIFILLIGVLITGSLYLYSYRERQQHLGSVRFSRSITATLPVYRHFSLPEKHQMGLQTTGDSIILCDLSTKHIYFMAADGRALGDVDIPKKYNTPFISMMNWDCWNGRLFVGDFRNSCLYNMDMLDTSKFIRHIKKKFYKIIPTDNVSYFLTGVNPGKQDYYFARLSENDTTPHTIPSLMDLYHYNNSFAYDGGMIRDKAGNIIYFFYNLSNFFSITNQGILRYHGSTIDNYQIPPTYIQNSDGSRTISPNYQVVNWVACTDGDCVYIVSNMRSSDTTNIGFGRQGVVDVYSNVDGHYLKSIALSMEEGEHVREIAITRNLLVTIQGDQVVEYQL